MTFGRGVTWFSGGPEGDLSSLKESRRGTGENRLPIGGGGGRKSLEYKLQSPQGGRVSFIVTRPETSDPPSQRINNDQFLSKTRNCA